MCKVNCTNKLDHHSFISSKKCNAIYLESYDFIRTCYSSVSENRMVPIPFECETEVKFWLHVEFVSLNISFSWIVVHKSSPGWKRAQLAKAPDTTIRSKIYDDDLKQSSHHQLNKMSVLDFESYYSTDDLVFTATCCAREIRYLLLKYILAF